METEFFTIIIGNPVDGIEAYGLFGDTSDANEWADAHIRSSQEWWVMRIGPPHFDLQPPLSEKVEEYEE